jgi:hypothetical protein
MSAAHAVPAEIIKTVAANMFLIATLKNLRNESMMHAWQLAATGSALL